jgi:Tfp pilus assembly protein PilO
MNTPKVTYKLLLGALGAFVVLCLLVIAVGWFYVLQMSDEVSVISTEALNMRQESSKLSELSIRFQKVLPQKNLVYGAIPTGKDVSTFMADLESTAKARNLTITSSVVGNSLTKAAKTGEFSQTVKKQEYYELPIRYEVTGMYGDFTTFIADLSNLRRLNTINDISVIADLSDKAVVGRVKASFNVILYAKK